MLQGKKAEGPPSDEIETAGKILIVGRSTQRIDRPVEGVIGLADKHGKHSGAELGDGIGEQVVIPQRISGADEPWGEIRLRQKQSYDGEERAA